MSFAFKLKLKFSIWTWNDKWSVNKHKYSTRIQKKLKKKGNKYKEEKRVCTLFPFSSPHNKMFHSLEY